MRTGASAERALGRIVVGVDGSEHADRAVRWAAEQAHRERRGLMVVVADDRDGRQWSGTITGRHPEETEPALRSARLIVDDAAALAHEEQPQVDVTALAVSGDAREVLVDLSATAHLLVVGSRGRGTLRSLFLGSVSSAVARSSACPVVVCRPGNDRPTDGVIVGADGSAESLSVLEFAFAQASLRGSHLTVVHCFWDTTAAVAGFREASAAVLNEPHLEELRLVLAESTAGFQEKYPDVDVSLLLRHGLVDEALTRRGKHWDLIVVGRHPVTTLERIIVGSISTAVLERSHCSVAVVPEATS